MVLRRDVYDQFHMCHFEATELRGAPFLGDTGVVLEHVERRR
jgi:hypothetical protein